MPQNDTITLLNISGTSFTGEGVHILAGFMHLCVSLKSLYSADCGITSDDLKLLLDKLSQLKSSSPSICSKLETWFLDNNRIDDSGVSALIDHLPSLFPRLVSCGYGVDLLSNNPVSSQANKRLKEEFERRRKVKRCVKVCLLFTYIVSYVVATPLKTTPSHHCLATRGPRRRSVVYT